MACSTEDTVNGPAASCNNQSINTNTCTSADPETSLVPDADPAPVPGPDPAPVPAPDPALVPVNHAPVTTPVSLATIGIDNGVRVITQSELLANANDIDGDALTITGLVIRWGAGTLFYNGNGTWNYTQSINEETSVSFSYIVTDGAHSVAGTASLDTNPFGLIYYVAPWGDDANDGSKDLPFKSVEKVLTVVAPGDLIYLRGGTYEFTHPNFQGLLIMHVNGYQVNSLNFGHILVKLLFLYLLTQN